MKAYDIVIIGAGSVGIPLSYYLARRGLRVCVIEKHPSVGRGQNRAAIGGIRATHSDPAKIKICLKSIDIIKNMESEHGMDIDWIQGGYLFPVYEEATEKALKELLVFQKKYDLNINWITSEQVRDIVPGINPDNLLGGTFSPEDGSASPLKTAGAFYTLATESGVDFKFQEVVTSIQSNSRRISYVETDRGRYPADFLIDCSGAGSREIGKMLDLDIPVYPDSHEAGITEPVKRFFEPMIVDIRSDDESANYYFYQSKEGQVVFCITPSPALPGKDTDNTSTFLPLVIKRMLNLYPRLRNLRVRRTWRGLYPMTPDGFPIVGFTKEFDNLLLAAGMCGQGFMLGPGLGEILSEIIIDKTSKYNDILDQLSLYRNFSGEEMLK